MDLRAESDLGKKDARRAFFQTLPKDPTTTSRRDLAETRGVRRRVSTLALVCFATSPGRIAQRASGRFGLSRPESRGGVLPSSPGTAPSRLLPGAPPSRSGEVVPPSAGVAAASAAGADRRSLIEVHRCLGPGVPEGLWACLCVELAQRGMSFECQQPLHVHYKGTRVESTNLKATRERCLPARPARGP